MKKFKFSIVIPTRNRAETLPYTIQTCLAQSHNNYEILVCDNFSSTDTLQAVEQFSSSQIKYVKSDKPLSMSDNWELAVSHVNGEYILVIGDDDALLPYALETLDHLIKHSGLKMIRWDRVLYSWPNMPIEEAANKLEIPLGQGKKILEGKKIIQQVANYKLDYTTLPMLYNSVIHHSLIDNLKEKTGRVFSGPIPDIYSGIAFAYLAGQYMSLDYPMSINAGSAKSNGVAHSQQGNQTILKEFNNLNTQAGFDIHPLLPKLQSISAALALADSFLRAKSLLFPNDTIKVKRKRQYIKIIKAINVKTEKEWKECMDIVYNSLNNDPKLQQWFKNTYKIKPFVSPPLPSKWKKTFNGLTLHLDASEFGVTDVAETAKLCQKILPNNPYFDSETRLSPTKKIRLAFKIVNRL